MNNKVVIRIKKDSNPTNTAKSISGFINKGSNVELNAIGAFAVNQAVKAIAIARGILAPVGKDLSIVPVFGETSIPYKKENEDTENDTTISIMRFIVRVHE